MRRQFQILTSEKSLLRAFGKEFTLLDLRAPHGGEVLLNAAQARRVPGEAAGACAEADTRSLQNLFCQFVQERKAATDVPAA